MCIKQPNMSNLTFSRSLMKQGHIDPLKQLHYFGNQRFNGRKIPRKKYFQKLRSYNKKDKNPVTKILLNRTKL